MKNLRQSLKKDGDKPVEHANPNRHGNRPAHPIAPASATGLPTMPCASAAWRLANARKPDTLLSGFGGATNGDRRWAPARSELRAG